MLGSRRNFRRNSPVVVQDPNVHALVDRNGYSFGRRELAPILIGPTLSYVEILLKQTSNGMYRVLPVADVGMIHREQSILDLMHLLFYYFLPSKWGDR